jgi:hypothetical protein
MIRFTIYYDGTALLPFVTNQITRGCRFIVLQVTAAPQLRCMGLNKEACSSKCAHGSFSDKLGTTKKTSEDAMMIYNDVQH